MNSLKCYLLSGIFFVLLAGTLSHFLYEWTNSHVIVGLFTPVNESIWEHMKLIFFPMLLYSPFLIKKVRKNYPCIISSIPFGILIGTIAVMIIFYTYTGILGEHTLFLDLVTFVVSDLLAFYTAYRFTLSCRLQNDTTLLYCLLCLFILCFFLFTYHPPHIGLFEDYSL